jgi:hypothetical protein
MQKREIEQMISESARLFIGNGDVHEIRILQTERDGLMSGYFDDPESLVRAVLPIDGHTSGVYVTLNPVFPELLARANNRLRRWVKEGTTKDTEIMSRKWALVDFDPIRFSGIPSSDEQHKLAMKTAFAAVEGLRKWGFTEAPVVASSGNGAHVLLYLGDWPNDGESTEAIKDILQKVKRDYGSDKIEVDQAVYNASRISRLYGCLNKKGDEIRGRPHRRSQIISWGDAAVAA